MITWSSTGGRLAITYILRVNDKGPADNNGDQIGQYNIQIARTGQNVKTRTTKHDFLTVFASGESRRLRFISSYIGAANIADVNRLLHRTHLS